MRSYFQAILSRHLFSGICCKNYRTRFCRPSVCLPARSVELLGFFDIDWRVSEEPISHRLQRDYNFTFTFPFRLVSITLGCGIACVPLFGELRILKIGSYAFGLRHCINQIVKSLKGFETLYFYLLYGVGIISVLLFIIYQGTLTQVCVRNPHSVIKNPEALTNELWQSLSTDPSK